MITCSLNQDFRLLWKLDTQKAYNDSQCGLSKHALHQTYTSKQLDYYR